MDNVQSGLSKFPWKRKSRKLHGTCCGLAKRIPEYGAKYVFEDSLFYIPTWTSSLRTWAQWTTVPPRYFRHGEKICRKIVIEHVRWLLQEPYWRRGYSQLQTNELQKDVQTWVQSFIFTFLLCHCMNLFSYSILAAIFKFLVFISTWKMILKHRTLTQLYIIVKCSKNHWKYQKKTRTEVPEKR